MQAISKILMTILFLLAIACAAGWIIGGKQTDNVTSQVFNASPPQIFPYLVEPDRLKQWFGGLVEIDPIVPNDPEARPAEERRTRRVMQDALGNRVEFDDEVIRFMPDKFVSVTSRNASEVVTWIYELEPKDDGQTKVTFRVIKKRLGLDRLLAPLRDDMVLEQIETDIRSLKRLAEDSPAPVERGSSATPGVQSNDGPDETPVASSEDSQAG